MGIQMGLRGIRLVRRVDEYYGEKCVKRRIRLSEEGGKR